MASSNVGWSQCTYTLQLSDDYGDGWNGNTIDVKLGTVTTNYTLYDNYDTTIFLTANTGDSIVLSYNATGLYQSEVSFELTDPNSTSLYSSGFAPPAGRNYDTTAVCPSCIAVNTSSLDSATASSVSFSWASTGAGQYSIEYGNCGFTPGTGTTVSTLNTYYTITSLASAQCVDVYITSDCSGSGNGLSAQAGPFSFVSLQSSVSSFPLLEDFESSNGGFLASGANSSWEWGAPANTFISAASGGTNAWVTNLDGNYSNNEMSYLTSPILDLSSVTDGIQLAFDIIYYTEDGYDESWIEISFDGGANWSKITDNGMASNWYNNTSSEIWEDQGAGWLSADIILDTVSGYSNAQIRFAMSSDFTVSYEGVGIDNFAITPLLCTLPTGLMSSNITTTSGDVSWTSTAAGSNIEWGPSGFAQGTGTFVYGNTTGTESISGLTPGMSYDVYIQDSCASGSVGIWRGPITFTTAQATISTLPYSEGFEASTGGWIQYGTDSPWEWGIPTGTLIFEAVQGQKAWVTNLDGDYGPNQTGYLQTPIFDLSAETGSLQMTFKYTSEAFDHDDAMWLEFSTDGTTWNKVVNNGSAANWYNQTTDETWVDTTSNGYWVESSFIFDTLAGESFVQFRFAFTSDTWTAYEGFGIDDFHFDVLSCTVPSAVSISNVTSTGADVNFTSGATGVNMEYGIAGFTPGSGTMVMNVTSPSALTNLMAGTPYEVYLQDSCGAGNVGVWVGPYTFTTEQAVINTFPYMEDFETTNGGWIQDSTNSTWEWGMPAGSVITNAGSGQNAWVTNLDGDYNNNENSYLRSVIFDCSALTNDIEYSFYMMHETENNYDEGWVEYSFDGSTWTKLVDNGVAQGWYNDLGNQWWEGDDLAWSLRSNVIPGSAGQSYVQIRHFFSSDVSAVREGFGIDNVMVEELSCALPSAQGATNVGTTSADLYWTSNGTQWNVEVGPQGFAPLTGVGTVSYVTNDTLSLNNLTQNTCYDFYVQDSCLGGNSVWVGPFSFCTMPTCPAPTTLDTNSVTANSANLTWVGNNATGDYQVEYGMAGFSLGTGTLVSSTTESLSLTNLSSASNYCFYVREICTAGDTSSWTGPFCFNTACGNFLGDSYTDPIVVSGSYPYTYTGSTSQCYTNAVSLRPNSTDVVFEYTASANVLTTSFETCGSGYDTYLYLVDASFNTVNQSDDDCGVQSQLMNEAVTPGATYYVVIEGYSASSKGAFVMTITENVACSAPTGIVASNETCDEVEINWSVTDLTTSFDIEYGATGFTPSAGTMVSSTDTSEVLSGLMVNTSYDVYVRAICASGDTSAWVGPVAVSTINATPAMASGTFTMGAVTLTDATVDFDGSASVGDSLSWDFGDGSPLVYGTTPTHLYTVNNTYDVVVTAIGECDTDSDTITITVAGISVEENMIHTFNVYPNPSAGVITVELDEVQGENATIALTDLQGRTLETIEADLSDGRTIQMDLSDLPRGVYMLRVSNQFATQVERIVLK